MKSLKCLVVELGGHCRVAFRDFAFGDRFHHWFGVKAATITALKQHDVYL